MGSDGPQPPRMMPLVGSSNQPSPNPYPTILVKLTVRLFLEPRHVVLTREFPCLWSGRVEPAVRDHSQFAVLNLSGGGGVNPFSLVPFDPQVFIDPHWFNQNISKMHCLLPVVSPQIEYLLAIWNYCSNISKLC